MFNCWKVGKRDKDEPFLIDEMLNEVIADTEQAEGVPVVRRDAVANWGDGAKCPNDKKIGSYFFCSEQLWGTTNMGKTKNEYKMRISVKNDSQL